MRKLKLTAARRQLFLKALSETGSVSTAVTVAGTSRTRVYELRKTEPAFARAWNEAEEIAVDRLEEEARRRAVEGVEEPLVSAGRLVRDDSGRPIMVGRYSDNLLMALIKAHQPPPREGFVPFPLPALQWVSDWPAAMEMITAAVAMGAITLSEAAALSKLVENYIRAIDRVRSGSSSTRG
jgi:hypothetical protein